MPPKPFNSQVRHRAYRRGLLKGGRLYVADGVTNSIAIYQPGALVSSRTIAGPHTHLFAPSGITVAPDGTIYVINAGAR